MRRTLAAAAFTFAALSGAAYAASPIAAKVEAPFAKTEKVIAAKAVWTCSGDVCATASDVKPTLRTCRALAKEVGRVTAFGPETAQLSAEDVAACNEWARPAVRQAKAPAATQTASR